MYQDIHFAVEGMHITGTTNFLTGKDRATSNWYDTRPKPLAFKKLNCHGGVVVELLSRILEKTSNKLCKKGTEDIFKPASP